MFDVAVMHDWEIDLVCSSRKSCCMHTVQRHRHPGLHRATVLTGWLELLWCCPLSQVFLQCRQVHILREWDPYVRVEGGAVRGSCYCARGSFDFKALCNYATVTVRASGAVKTLPVVMLLSFHQEWRRGRKPLQSGCTAVEEQGSSNTLNDIVFIFHVLQNDTNHTNMPAGNRVYEKVLMHK